MGATGGKTIITTKEQRREKSWHCLCVAHFWRCLSDRSWSFFLPLYLSKHCGSIKPTSVVTFVQNLSIVLGGTQVANLFRRQKSVSLAFTVGTIVENSAVALGGALICYVVASSAGQSNNHNFDHGDFCQQPLHSIPFIIGLVCMAIDAVCSSFLGMLVSKEWVAVLFSNSDNDKNDDNYKNQQQQQQLAHANARLAKIDLAVATCCPLFISSIIEYYGSTDETDEPQNTGYDFVVWLLISQHLIGAIWILRNINQAWKFSPQLLYSSESSSALNTSRKEEKNDAHGTNDPKITKHGLHKENNSSYNNNTMNTASSSLSMLMNLPRRTQLVIMAYILLYFTVLSPGAMLNSWMNSLHQRNDGGAREYAVSERMIAIFGSSSQFCGAIATMITPQLIMRQQQASSSSSSLYYAGMKAQWFQAICVLLAFVCFHLLDNGYGGGSTRMSSWYLLHGFLVCIGISRIGLWSFDLVERQILQKEDITALTNDDGGDPTKSRKQKDNDHNPSSNSIRTILFNAEKGATQAISLLMTFLCYVFSDRFDVLITLSTLAVTTSAVLLYFAAVKSQGL
mmetsp:Transcript_23076/g.35614  ORF Transcript_23076/g.35614 Transcript_23076/m.35614 type:complete len:568 (-) Transcript_23076:1097-2800(-)